MFASETQRCGQMKQKETWKQIHKNTWLYSSAVLSMTMGCFRLFKQMTSAVVSGLGSLMGLVPH